MRNSPNIWFDTRAVAVSSILSGTILAFSAIGAASAERDTDALVKDALSAAPPMIAKTAMVMDWDGTMLLSLDCIVSGTMRFDAPTSRGIALEMHRFIAVAACQE